MFCNSLENQQEVCSLRIPLKYRIRTMLQEQNINTAFITAEVTIHATEEQKNAF